MKKKPSWSPYPRMRAIRLIKSAEASLQHRAAALGFDDLLAVGVGTLIDELESDFLDLSRDQRKIDAAHAAERQEL